MHLFIMESVGLIISNNVHFQLPRRVIRAYENQTVFSASYIMDNNIASGIIIYCLTL